jgi:hypothetical protein
MPDGYITRLSTFATLQTFMGPPSDFIVDYVFVLFKPSILWRSEWAALTHSQWRYIQVPQKEFQSLQPTRLADLTALAPALF